MIKILLAYFIFINETKLGICGRPSDNFSWKQFSIIFFRTIFALSEHPSYFWKDKVVRAKNVKSLKAHFINYDKNIVLSRRGVASKTSLGSTAWQDKILYSVLEAFGLFTVYLWLWPFEQSALSGKKNLHFQQILSPFNPLHRDLDCG